MMHAMRIRHSIPLLLAVLALGGCGGKPERPADTRPEWRSAAIDGIAPLMSTREVAAALIRHGYVQTPCTSGGKMLAYPLDEAGHPCFESAGRSTTISLFFLELNEGRRLAVVNFHWFELPDATDAKRLAVSSTIAKRLRARFGKPSATVDQLPDFRSLYWDRPGGRSGQPDTITTSISGKLSPGITMTSMWAYAQVRRDP